MEIEKIEELLKLRFDQTPEFPKTRRIIFWYDERKDFKDIIPELQLDNVKIISIQKGKDRRGNEIFTNIFKIKYTLEYEDLDSNYLIYSEYPKPEDAENLLIDIERYSEFFIADKSAMIIEEFKLDRNNYAVVQVVKEHIDFFASKERKEKLVRFIEKPDQIDARELKRSILAVITNSKSSDIREIVKNVIINQDNLQIIDKWMGIKFLYDEIKDEFGVEIDDFTKFIKVIMTVFFYRELQVKPHTNLENYYCGKTNEIYIFVSSLLQSKQFSKEICKIFYEYGKELNIAQRIDELDLDTLAQGTAFEYFDKLIIKQIALSLNSELLDYEKYLKYINIRLDNTLWKEEYIEYYKMLIAALEIFRIKEVLVLKEKDLKGIFKDYTENYYKVDRFYREFFSAYDRIKVKNSISALDELEKKISYFYDTEYLDQLLEIWSQKIQEKDDIPAQRNFYGKYIKSEDIRTAVVISDGLRYEVGSEIAERLSKELSAKEITIEGVLTDLPSITPVGMANLLPDNNRVIDLPDKIFTVGNISSNTTENREKILQQVSPESSAITFGDFKNMSRAEQDNYVKGKKVIYIYHDTIDSIGDKGKTEDKTFEACESAVKDITGIIKLLSSLGIVNVFITSDHGFMYERKPVEEYNKIDLDKTNGEPLNLGKRYAIYKEKVEQKGCVTAELDGYYGVFPKKNQRIKVSGSGLQFVHGGISPQEMIIPVIQYRGGANSKKAVKTGVRIRENSGKITSNLTKFAVYQLNAVDPNDKVIERDISAALYDGNVRVSNEIRIRLNATEDNYQHDFSLTLSGQHKKLILKIIDVETGDILDSKEYNVNISIISEFDF